MTISEKDVVQLFSQEYSWEQILYRIIAVEAMDPWNLSIAQLSDSFVQTIASAETLDFKVPAKYIMIAAVLLKMKAERLDVVQDILQNQTTEQLLQTAEAVSAGQTPPLLLNPLSIPPNRTPLRKVMVSELIDALRKALRTSERRDVREVVAREKIDIRPENLGARIAALYSRLSSLIGSLRKEEVPFSQLVGQWDRKTVLDNFIPLVYLDHNKQVDVRQDEFFQEIFVKKRDAVEKPPAGNI